MDNRQKMTLVLNIKYFYIQIHNYVVLSLACLCPYLLMFIYTATISKNLGPTGLLPNQLTSRLGWNFTYNNVSDRSTNELEASQLTSCNHPLRILGIQKILRKSLKCLDCKYPKAKFSVKICKKPAVKHSIEKAISRNFVNLSTTFCPRLQFVLISYYEDGITKDESTKFHHFFISNTFLNNARLKLAKKKINQILRSILRVNFYYLKIIHILYPCYHPKIIGHILKNKERTDAFVFIS